MTAVPAPRFPLPWGPSLVGLRPPRIIRLGPTGAPRRTPVLVHSGFLIAEHHIWHASRLIPDLRRAGHEIILLEEHHVHELGPAHALGHRVDLALAQTLSMALDLVADPFVDLLTAGAGTVPALILALNDERVRRLALADPVETLVGADGRIDLEGHDAPTDVEMSLGVDCGHASLPSVAPAPGLRLRLASLSSPVLIVANRRHRQAARDLAAALPRGTGLQLDDDDAPVVYDPRVPALLEGHFTGG
jgi:hypothetical protein